ncbi:MAG: outer membrane lipoprotein LolB [Gammaproteobacteria bacterium]|nr:outer membrane lipoprotein LolB [Gammaproteobacteria bacterium]MDE2345285.1 outer membrane lipoprotein LolB [Gammaproteobacteria bacterium]
MNTRVLLLASLLAITGCASVPGAPPSGAPNEAAWQNRSQQLQKITDWELQGRVGIINGKQGGSGSMEWIQRGRQLTFSFRGPFGAGSLLVQGDADALWVRSSRGDNFISTNPQQDFSERLHIPLPILSMRYWMLGLPDPRGAFTKSVDARGHLVVLVQRGWQVDYQDYASFDGTDLPTRLLISHGIVRIKVAVNDWRIWPVGTQAHTHPP